MAMADAGCRPAKVYLAGRVPLPHEFVQHDGYDGPQQDENRTDNADLMLAAVAFLAVAFFPGHCSVPLLYEATCTTGPPPGHGRQLHRTVRNAYHEDVT